MGYIAHVWVIPPNFFYFGGCDMEKDDVELIFYKCIQNVMDNKNKKLSFIDIYRGKLI